MGHNSIAAKRLILKNGEMTKSADFHEFKVLFSCTSILTFSMLRFFESDL